MKDKSKVFIICTLVMCLLLAAFTSNAQLNYTDWFTSNTMRVDYYHSGTDKSEYAMLKEIRKEEFWGGTKTNLIDPNNYGSYRVHIYDSASNKLIFTYGFCSLFEEWQFTDEALVLERGFPESLIFPYPLKTVRVELKSRGREMTDDKFSTILELFIDPDANYINKEKSVKAATKQIHKSAEPDKALDLVFIADAHFECMCFAT